MTDLLWMEEANAFGVAVTAIHVPEPDLVLPLGPRSLLSLLGSGMLSLEILYRACQQDRPKRMTPNEEEDASTSSGPKATPNPAASYRQALPSEWKRTGSILYGISFLFPTDGSCTPTIHALTLTAAATALGIEWISSPWRSTNRNDHNNSNRTVLLFWDTNDKKKAQRPWVLVGIHILLLVLTGGGTLIGGSPQLLVLRATGMVTILAAWKVLWNVHWRGDSWERFAYRPTNPMAGVHHAGGPMLVLGWFTFWIGTAAKTTAANFGTDLSISWPSWSSWQQKQFIPLYFTLQLHLFCAAAFGMVPIVLLLDEGAELTAMVSERMVDSMDGSMRIPSFS